MENGRSQVSNLKLGLKMKSGIYWYDQCNRPIKTSELQQCPDCRYKLRSTTQSKASPFEPFVSWLLGQVRSPTATGSLSKATSSRSTRANPVRTMRHNSSRIGSADTTQKA